ncbi:MAG: hypothetical protein Ct9H300mP19_10150 [Dehalococcoidia bacterium]|nr:MAG: hypothetical protein Ct9H300mP19_10150 [Dehalococcoidia bacterium]
MATQKLEAYEVICSTAHQQKSHVIDSQSNVEILNIEDRGLNGVQLEFKIGKETIRSHLPPFGGTPNR